jgi:hypothetical protein
VWRQQNAAAAPGKNPPQTHKRARRTAGDGAEPLLARGVPNLQLDPFVVEEHLLDLEVDPVLVVVVLEKGGVSDSFQALWTRGCAHTLYARTRTIGAAGTRNSSTLRTCTLHIIKQNIDFATRRRL